MCVPSLIPQHVPGTLCSEYTSKISKTQHCLQLKSCKNLSPLTQPWIAQDCLVYRQWLSQQRWPKNSYRAEENRFKTTTTLQEATVKQQAEVETHLCIGWLQGASCTPLLIHSSTHSPMHILWGYTQPCTHCGTAPAPQEPGAAEGHTAQPTWEGALLHLPDELLGFVF